MDNAEIESRVRIMLAHEVRTASNRAVIPHAEIANLTATLASLSGMVTPLENTVTGVEPEPADPMRTACLAVEAVIGAWRTESRGFRSWWVNLGGSGIGHAHDAAAEAVRDALAADGAPVPDDEPTDDEVIDRLFSYDVDGETTTCTMRVCGLSHAIRAKIVDDAGDRGTDSDITAGQRDLVLSLGPRIASALGVDPGTHTNDLVGMVADSVRVADRLRKTISDMSTIAARDQLEIKGLQSSLAMALDDIEPKRLVPRRPVDDHKTSHVWETIALAGYSHDAESDAMRDHEGPSFMDADVTRQVLDVYSRLRLANDEFDVVRRGVREMKRSFDFETWGAHAVGSSRVHGSDEDETGD